MSEKKKVQVWQIVVWCVLAAFGIFGLCMFPVWLNSERWIAAGEYKSYEKRIDELDSQIETLNNDLVSRNREISHLKQEIEDTTGFGYNEYFTVDETNEISRHSFLEGYDYGFEDGADGAYDPDIYNPDDALFNGWGEYDDPAAYREWKAKQEQKEKEAAEAALQAEKENATFIVNRASGIYHAKECSSVKSISEDNIVYWQGTEDELLEKGYHAHSSCLGDRITPLAGGEIQLDDYSDDAEAFDESRFEIVATPESSVFSRIGYDADSRRLLTDFQTSGLYVYVGVPESMWDALKDAESKGAYFNEHIKEHYQYAKIK